ncbi:MAG TPA: LLM class flavin-dependent oxidoreductase [Chloroflexota bacterium]
MKIGLNISNIEPLGGGRILRFSDVRAMAQRAEAVGFDSVWLADHFMTRVSGEEDRGLWEAFTFLSALAAVTSRIHLGSLVACTSFRHPTLLAKMADGLDEISGGRFVLGVGAGWHEPEYRAFGYPFDHRAGRFDEALQIIVTLLRTGRVTFAGQYYQANDAVLRPRGPSPIGPPVWVGGSGPRMLELTACYADGWNCDATEHRADFIAGEFQRVRQACERVGRDPATLTLTAQTEVRMLAPGETKRHDDGVMTGTPDEVAEMLHACAEVGVEHLMVLDAAAQDVAGVERLGRVRELLRRS